MVLLVRFPRLDTFRCKLKAKFALTYIVQILWRSTLPVKIQVATHLSFLFWVTFPVTSCPSHKNSVQSQLHKWQKEGCAILRGGSVPSLQWCPSLTFTLGSFKQQVSLLSCLLKAILIPSYFADSSWRGFNQYHNGSGEVAAQPLRSIYRWSFTELQKTPEAS